MIIEIISTQKVYQNLLYLNLIKSERIKKAKNEPIVPKWTKWSLYEFYFSNPLLIHASKEFYNAAKTSQNPKSWFVFYDFTLAKVSKSKS